MSLIEHKKKDSAPISCKVITVSDTRTTDTDKSGQLMHSLLQEAGHHIAEYEIVPDEEMLIKSAAVSGCKAPGIDAVLISGGTGIAKRDVTIEAVLSIIQKELPGFGEIFRMLSYQEDIGSAAILSRAAAGTADNTIIFSMPGSTGAVKLAMEKLILPELGHIVKELKKDLG
ncbi:MogA/MoaB family molybdenum cofactor biosynthesis protein [Metabacillus indicus]|uniref:MogA/MoaB family molybdenum cofactor biosynthesis protein n=1 Tax=Metabacillus indicus TaxID=246786 RepID=UPI0024908157|nr:MogA/MoaB family molybdenum cofactor biosynthesis protein [Metabacillus indicus]